MVALSLLLQMVTTGGRYSFGVFLEPMSRELDISIGWLSFIVSLFLLTYGVLGPAVGGLADRIGPRRVMLPGVLLMTGGMALAGFSQNVFMFAVAMVLLIGIGFSFMSPVVHSTLISRWFDAKKGQALGISSSGIAVGQMILVPVAMAITLQLGWRYGYWSLALMLGLMFPVLLLWLRDQPEESGHSAQERAQGAAAAAGGQPFSFQGVMGKRAFWYLVLSFFGCGFTMLMMVTHLPNLMVQWRLPEMVGALAISVIGAASAAGSIGVSGLSDKVGRGRLLAALYLTRVLMLLLIIFWPSTVTIYVFAVVFGATWIVTSPITAALSGDIFGRFAVGRVFGACYLAHQIGGFIGTTVAGFLYDLTGGYTIALWLAVAISLNSFILAGFLAANPARRADRRVAQAT